jgi:hypothetical protein
MQKALLLKFRRDVPAQMCPHRYRLAASTQPRLNQVEQAPDWLNFLPRASGNPLTCLDADPPAQPGRPRRFTAPLPAADRQDQAKRSLTWGFTWWQVLGSNQRRLSRRFYRPLPLATRATCLAPSRRTGTVKDSGRAPVLQHRLPRPRHTGSTPHHQRMTCTGDNLGSWQLIPHLTSCPRSTGRKRITP